MRVFCGLLKFLKDPLFLYVRWGGDIEKGLASGLRFDDVSGAGRDEANGIDWLRLSLTRARPAFIAGGDAISLRHEGDGRRVQNA